jgi:thiamine biosynthesis lipoprotein
MKEAVKARKESKICSCARFSTLIKCSVMKKCQTMKKIFLLLIVLTLVSSCSKKEELYKETRVIMGTYVTITLNEDGKSQQDLTSAGGDAFSQVEKVDRLMSTYKPESNLSRINRSAGIAPVKADPEVIDNIEKAIYVAKLTDGAFDVTVGPLVNAWKIGSRDARVPSPDEIKRALSLVGYRNIDINKKDGTVFINKRGASIDLGGIAKGYASDRAVEVLRKAGIKGGIVACAGDIKVFGLRPDGAPWTVGIQHPRREDGALMAKITLTDAALSTSGDYERYFMKDGVRYHHIIDPRTGYPARGLMSVTVLSRESWLSDSMATGLFVMGPDKAYALALKHPEFEVLMITGAGKVLATGRFKGIQVEPVEPDKK